MQALRERHKYNKFEGILKSRQSEWNGHLQFKLSEEAQSPVRNLAVPFAQVREAPLLCHLDCQLASEDDLDQCPYMVAEPRT